MQASSAQPGAAASNPVLHCLLVYLKMDASHLLVNNSALAELKANTIRAVTCDFQQCGILESLNSREPAQPPFKLRQAN